MEMLSKQEIISLVNEIMECEGTEEDQEKLVEKLMQGVLDPNITNYVFWSDMTSEEIAEKALAYCPIYL